MRLAILTSVRLIGEGVAASLRTCGCGYEPVVVQRIAELRSRAASEGLRLAIIDVTQSPSLEPIRAFHRDYPDLPLIAMGLRGQEVEFVDHGSAGFTGFLLREDGLDKLREKVADALSGRLDCSPEIMAGIMRELFRRGLPDGARPGVQLTEREDGVADLLRRGLSNKEIARELALSESTVKHHVHSILAKKRLGSRFQMIREARGSEEGRRAWG